MCYAALVMVWSFALLLAVFTIWGVFEIAYDLTEDYRKARLVRKVRQEYERLTKP